MLMPLNNFKGQYSKNSFVIRTNEVLDCKSKNLVYLITCKICRIQYVGETGREFSVRMREHWDKIKKGDKSQLVYAHFHSDEIHRNSKIEDMLRFQIIEKIKTEDLDNQELGMIRKRRLERELYWIAKLRTAHPLGLNDKIQACGISGNATDRNFVDFNFYRISNMMEAKSEKFRNRHLRKKKGNIQDTDMEMFSLSLERLFRTEKYELEILIASKSRKFLEIFKGSRYFRELNSNVRHFIDARVAYTKKVRPKRKETDDILWQVDFAHKIVDGLNIKALYNRRDLKDKLPAEVRRKGGLRIVYKYGRSIGSKILNYNQVLKDMQDMSYEEIEALECNCAESELVNQHHGHIMTGDLQIIKDNDLRELCARGTKFREVPFLDCQKIKNNIRTNVDSLISKMVSKYKISRGSLKVWKADFLKLLDGKIDFRARSNIHKRPVLSNINSKRELDRLRESFVITVVDKAAGNFAFTCRKFYLLRLARELGINNVNPGNDTYEYQNSSEQEICDRLLVGLAGFGITPDISDRKIAMLYHNPKFHKNPVKFRFIAGNVKVITSRLDETVAKILKMCKGHFVSLLKKYESYSGIRYCFDIEKSSDLKDGLGRFRGNAESISINDFATLYTLFEHDHLMKNMRWLMDRLGKNSGNHCIGVSYTGAYWARDSSKPGIYTVTEILEMIGFLISNSYVKALGKIFRQTKGIIMGGKISGWLSDCSLMVDEFLFIDRKVKAGEVGLARQFKGLNRYRDDCSALNIDGFREIARDIYPPSLELSQENDDLRQATVLDMQVSIDGGNFITKVYNKTDSFPFDVISMPFLESNIEEKICYKVFYSQVLRYQRLCTNIEDFCYRTKMLGEQLIERGYKFSKLSKEFVRVLGNYRGEFERWVIPVNMVKWFQDIFNNSLYDPINLNSPVSDLAFNFSQPAPEHTIARIHFYSQF